MLLPMPACWKDRFLGDRALNLRKRCRSVLECSSKEPPSTACRLLGVVNRSRHEETDALCVPSTAMEGEDTLAHGPRHGPLPHRRSTSSASGVESTRSAIPRCRPGRSLAIRGPSQAAQVLPKAPSKTLSSGERLVPAWVVAVRNLPGALRERSQSSPGYEQFRYKPESLS